MKNNNYFLDVLLILLIYTFIIFFIIATSSTEYITSLNYYNVFVVGTSAFYSLFEFIFKKSFIPLIYVVVIYTLVIKIFQYYKLKITIKNKALYFGPVKAKAKILLLTIFMIMLICTGIISGKKIKLITKQKNSFEISKQYYNIYKKFDLTSELHSHNYLLENDIVVLDHPQNIITIRVDTLGRSLPQNKKDGELRVIVEFGKFLN